MRHAALLLAAAFVSVPAVADTPSRPTQAAAKPTKPEDKVVCRFVNTTGSRLLGERVCKTRGQWEADADTTRDILENAERHPTGTPVNDSGQIDLGPH
jgi:hypothetical protein